MARHERGRKCFNVYSNSSNGPARTMKTIYFEMEMWWMYYGILSAVSIENSILKCRQMYRMRLYFCLVTCYGPHKSDQSGHSRGLRDSLNNLPPSNILRIMPTHHVFSVLVEVDGAPIDFSFGQMFVTTIYTWQKALCLVELCLLFRYTKINKEPSRRKNCTNDSLHIHINQYARTYETFGTRSPLP